jgi:SAM-dependent methyltransferase
MFSETAQYYDLIYSSLKDYEVEAARISEIIRDEHPAASQILDVACGSGQHASFLAQKHGYTVDGIDLDRSFVEIARSKPGIRSVHHTDMTLFDLPERYDVILCLFSSIGYVRTLDNIVLTLERFRKHLNENGVVIVEPWLEPGVIDPDRISSDTAIGDNVHVCRMARITVEGPVSTIHFEYLIGQPSGINHFSEKHELGLFTREEMANAFESAGFRIKYDPDGISGRGLYVASVR